MFDRGFILNDPQKNEHLRGNYYLCMGGYAGSFLHFRPQEIPIVGISFLMSWKMNRYQNIRLFSSDSKFKSDRIQMGAIWEKWKNYLFKHLWFLYFCFLLADLWCVSRRKESVQLNDPASKL